MTTEKLKLCRYIAAYIQEELGRGVQPSDIGAWLIADAMDAYDGGAAEDHCEEEVQTYIKRLETSVPTKPGMYLRLLHGRPDPNQQMDDWGDNGPLLGPLKWAHITYNNTINICAADDPTDPDENGTGPLMGNAPLRFEGDMLYYDGMFYGDWELEVMP